VPAGDSDRGRPDAQRAAAAPGGRSGSGAVGKTLVLIGLGVVALGLLIMAGVPFGRLPGDIYVRRDSFSFYFPLTTSIILSIILTLLFALFRR
jgi:hypothetical protein